MVSCLCTCWSHSAFSTLRKCLFISQDSAHKSPLCGPSFPFHILEVRLPDQLLCSISLDFSHRTVNTCLLCQLLKDMCCALSVSSVLCTQSLAHMYFLSACEMSKPMNESAVNQYFKEVIALLWRQNLYSISYEITHIKL